MLDADQDRRLFVEALAPPEGYVLSEAIGTTYSLELDALLMVPAHMALSSLRDRGANEEERFGLLAALRRATGRVSVYFQSGRIGEPRVSVLYGLLEGMVVPAFAPKAKPGGAGEFHPKMWLLRFTSDDREAPVRMRALVLSRNLTFDRSWDVSLCVDGEVRGRNQTANRGLADLVARLPDLARVAVAQHHRDRSARLSEEVRRVEWELPHGYDDLEFIALGLGAKEKPWRPARCQRLVVVSPFVSEPVLGALAEQAREPLALVSRSDELDATEGALPFPSVFVLDDAAQTEDGEETTSRAMCGLHAKIYLAKDGWDTRIYLGSANATVAGLGMGSEGPCNVEILAALQGKASKVKAFDHILGEDALGPYLVPWVRRSPSPDESAVAAAERTLDEARRALAWAELKLNYTRDGERWAPTLAPTEALPLPGISTARLWLPSFGEGSASDAMPLRSGEAVRLASCDRAEATGFINVELTVSEPRTSVRFTLLVPTEGLPADRDASIVRRFIQNEERFLAYVLALLGIEQPVLGPGELTVSGGQPGSWQIGGLGSSGLLERLIRARSRDPQALVEIGRVMEDLLSTSEGETIVPAAFRRVWAHFQPELNE
jgi:hypothetical protein